MKQTGKKILPRLLALVLAFSLLPVQVLSEKTQSHFLPMCQFLRKKQKLTQKKAQTQRKQRQKVQQKQLRKQRGQKRKVQQKQLRKQRGQRQKAAVNPKQL